MQTMPPAQLPAQIPVANGAHADPGANPNASQSLSRWQAAQPLAGMLFSPQNRLPAVVRKHTQVVELLQTVCPGFAASHIPGCA